MDTPRDPHARVEEPGDDDVARSLRTALGEPATPPPGERAPREVLARLERRAAGHQRRRQAVAALGTAAAAAVVVAVGGLVLPQLTSLGSGVNESTAAGPADEGAAADGGAAGDGSAEAASVAGLGAASMLTAADVTAFGDVAVQDAEPVDATAAGLPLTACVDGDAGTAAPVVLWRVDLVAAPGAALAAEPPGLVERAAQFTDPAQVSDALAAVEAALPSCAAAGPEGTGPTTQLDPASVTPDGGQALVLASTSGLGSPTLTLYLARGDTLVQLQVTSNAATAEDALADAAPTAAVAVARATGPAGAP